MSPSFARNTLLGFASGAAVALAGFVGNAVVARLLGPEKLGVFAYAVWCVTVAATVAAMGIDLVQQRFIPNLRAEGRNDEAEGLIGTTTRFSMMSTVVVGVVLFGYLYWPGRSAMEGGSEGSRDVILAVALTWFVCWKLSDLYLFYLRGEQRFGELARLSAVSALMKVATMALGAWLFGIPGALAGYIAGTVLPASRMFRLLRKKPSVDAALKREVIRFALGSWVAGVIGTLVFGRTQIVFLEHYTGLGAVGMFAAAVTVAEMAVQLPPLLLSALLPRFSEQHGLGAHESMLRLYRTTTALIAMVIVPLCLGLAAIAPVLIPVLFGAEFADAIPVASVLLIAAAVSSLGVTTLYLLYSAGKTGLLVVSNGVGLAGTVALGFLLIPRFGLMGAAWSRGTVQVLVVLIETWYVTRRLNFAPPYRVLGVITLASVAQGVAAYVISVEVGGAVSLALSIPAAILVYVVALRALSVTSMIDPGLTKRLIEHLPERSRPLIRKILKLPVPPASSAAN
ncbi:membrane protein involved in the export of O-antigen and teichoic acid [Mycolicibacterium chubuense NBB4]|uniref:Membrane protein involved in the export of O-antigen and teichoic acid n=1 Tax=Mycolicibacterium chubuense (strain NBB4) TaxID=710421 RepID=I4BFN0_MYCCN|nr:polysaccharide biosynthesis C-terminal domain-containing protein [Mycolicibacterium chubuense]AFM16087.1 membrane protein involved in the export of O-antigen and teichoic acid [Mycolicibacterium chubuense NBB4]